MQDQAMVKEAHHTTHLEGTALTLTQASLLLQGHDLDIAYDDDVQELRNYKAAFDFVLTYLVSGKSVTEGSIREIHKRLVSGVRSDTARPGEYRGVHDFIANSKTGEIIYEPPGADSVPMLMSDLVQWIQNPSSAYRGYSALSVGSHSPFFRWQWQNVSITFDAHSV